MKIFLKKIIYFSLMFLIFLELLSFIILVTGLFKLNRFPGREIYNAISKSYSYSNKKTLLLGDSVASQIFSNNNEFDSINSLATNQAIGIAGNYFLLYNYLKKGNKIDSLVLFFIPESFGNNFSQKYTYHYFLKPFNNSNYSSLFTKDLKIQIRKINYNSFSQIPHVKISSWSPKLQSPDARNYTFLSPLSIEYLNRIKLLSLEYDFNIIIKSPPLSETKRSFVLSIDKTEILSTDLSNEFNEYFKSIYYLNNNEFVDNTHLKSPNKYFKK